MPFQKGDIVSVRVDDIGSDGAGIGKADGFTLFVKDAVPGDVVTAAIMKIKKGYGYARLLQVTEPSPFRVAARCPSARQCGGCQLQELSYEQQLVFKEKKVRDVLLRIGGFSEEEVQKTLHPVIGMENPWRFRNKEQLPVGLRNGKPTAGFYAGHTHSIVPVADCLAGPAANREILETVLQYMADYGVTAYEEETGKGQIRHVLIRSGWYTGEVMVCLVVNGTRLPHEKELTKRLLSCSLAAGEDAMPAEEAGNVRPQIAAICLNTNTARSNVILGRETRTLWGKSTITDVMHVMDVETGEGNTEFRRTGRQVQFQISPVSFYQVNPIQAERLYSLVRNYAGLTGKEIVWDLYCGVGTIGCFLAADAGEVYGVEVIPEAVRDAGRNAACNGLANASFHAGKAEEVVPAYVQQQKIERTQNGSAAKADSAVPGESFVDVVVVDPPRKGCDEKCLQTILEVQPKRIVYVSCDPATMARDCKVLAAGGYELRRVQPVDQFPHTVHVETVCLLSKLHEAKHHVNVKVSSLYIAQVKQKHGIIERENYNKPKSETAKQPQCPDEKEAAIVEALKHFGMVQ